MALQGELPLQLSESECAKPQAFLLGPYLIFSLIWLHLSGVAANHLRLHTNSLHFVFHYISFVILQSYCIAISNHRNHLNLVPT